MDLTDQSSTFNWFWRLSFNPHESPPTMPPEGHPPQQQPWLVSVALPALPPGLGFISSTGAGGMCWIPTPGLSASPAPPVHIVREICPGTGIQSLTLPKPRIISFICQSIYFNDWSFKLNILDSYRTLKKSDKMVIKITVNLQYFH